MPFDSLNLLRHALSSAYPAMTPEDFQALSTDIRLHGLREPIVIFEGQVLDGWHRYNACLTENVPAMFVEFDEGDPVDFVRSKNRHRRHLTASQIAAAEIRLHEWRPRGGDQSAPGALRSDSTDKDIAAKAGVSERTVEQAKAAERAGLGDMVRDGKVSAKQAAQIAKAPPKVQAEAKKAIEAGERPVLPKPAKAPEMSQAEKLEIENEELRDRLGEMARDLEVYLKIEEADGKTDGVIKDLTEKLRAVEKVRDTLLTENAQLKREIKSLHRKLGMKA